jgi:hypothetical protein
MAISDEITLTWGNAVWTNAMILNLLKISPASG